MSVTCPLCSGESDFFYKDTQTYYRCERCDGIFVQKEELPDSVSEKKRYELHDDDTADDGYRKFVSPITSSIMTDFTHKDKGLDFGAGTSAIISVVLREKDYSILNYDPYFHIHPELLKEKYDYISSCEVIEHFYKPYKEFKLLKSMLKNNGKMYLMTEPYNEGIDFASWYYKNDPTHVFLYTQKTFQWIKLMFGFSDVSVGRRLITFENKKGDE